MRRLLDATAISLSALCFVHCLILPVAALSLPLFDRLANAEYIHWLFLMLAAPIAAAALGPALREKPAPKGMAALAVCGLLLLLAGALDAPSHFWGAAFTVAGGFSVAGAHVLNWRRRHAHAHHGPARL